MSKRNLLPLFDASIVDTGQIVEQTLVCLGISDDDRYPIDHMQQYKRYIYIDDTNDTPETLDNYLEILYDTFGEYKHDPDIQKIYFSGGMEYWYGRDIESDTTKLELPLEYDIYLDNYVPASWGDIFKQHTVFVRCTIAPDIHCVPTSASVIHHHDDVENSETDDYCFQKDAKIYSDLKYENGDQDFMFFPMEA